MTKDSAQLDNVRSDFIERIGIVAQSEGMPRIAGRIFAALVFDGKPIAFGTLADTLQVSRASISSSARLLEERGVIKRLSRKGERQDFFQLADNAYAIMLRGVQMRAARAKAEIDLTFADLPSEQSDIRRRLQDYSGFYAAITDAVGTAIHQISDAKS